MPEPGRLGTSESDGGPFDLSSFEPKRRTAVCYFHDQRYTPSAIFEIRMVQLIGGGSGGVKVSEGV